jgi:hypothetical protein
MMKDEILTIAGREVDIIPNTITRTLQINDLGSAEDRQSNYSNTIMLPMTANNKMVFGFLGVVGSTSRSQYQNLPCTYSVQGIPLIVNGSAEIQSTNSYYEVVIIDGIADLAERIKNKSLSDLNYSDLNHFLNPTTYTDSFDNTSGYIYALGHFGLNNSGIQVERQVPSLYVHTIWDKIFSQAGLSYEGDFFETNDDFKTEVITPAQGYEVEDVQPSAENLGFFNTDTINRNDRYRVVNDEDFIIEDITTIFNFDTTISDSRFTFENYGRIRINKKMRLRTQISLNYTANSPSDSFRVGINGNDFVTANYLDPNETSITIDLNFDLEEGDEIYFLMGGTQVLLTEFGDEDFYEVKYGGSASITLSELTGGFYIDFNNIMGDMTQQEFIKDILYRYGLILKPINNNTGYEFIQYEKLLNNRVGSEDWTDKLVNIENEDYSSDYAKRNKAKYEYHEDIVVPSYDGELLLDVENIKNEDTFFSSPYEIPTNYKTYRGNTLYYHPVWEEKDEDGSTIIKVKEAPYKLFRINRINSTLGASFFNDATSVSFTGEVPYLTLDNINLQYFLNNYYKAFRLSINSYKEVEMNMNLSEYDIYKIDFFKLKYLKQTGKYYYLNKLKHTSKSSISEVTMIEINEFSSNAPVDALGTYTYTISYDSTRTVNIDTLINLSNPAYSDPEFDAAFKVKFLTGNGSEIKLYQDDQEITSGQEILVSDWNVQIEDMGINLDAHTHTWDYQVMDEGSGEYGSEVGQITVDVLENVNTVPFADAGSDFTKFVEDFGSGNQTASLNGFNSFDNTGEIVSYEWVITSSPVGSGAAISDADTSSASAVLVLPNNRDSAGEYTIELTVTDNFGLTDTDTINVSVSVFEGGFEGEL